MMRVLVRLTGLAAAAILALLVPGALSAQDSTATKNHLYDKFQVGAAFSTVINNSNMRLDGSDGRGTELKFRDRLGIDGSTIQPAIGLRWKPGRRTEFSVGYQFLNQSGEKSTSADSIVIGDNTLSGDISLNSKVGADNATFQFKYSILAAERHNIGLAIGFGAIFFDVSFDGSASVCNGTECAGGDFDYSNSVTGPTASLGAFGRWRLGDSWYVGGDVRGIGAKVDRYDFSVFEGDAVVQYFLSDRWGLDLSWYYTDVSVDVGAKDDATAAEDLIGKISFNYSSLRLGVIAAF